MARRFCMWARLKARVRLCGWSDVASWGVIYAGMGLWVLALIREGLTP